ncbi:TIGR03086 family protein [Gordonia jinghuaiqii]|uniref:TIGR03086 family protein n=1 Tax=Gordonia jinghuaiqii TaxID=2758710 RepID=A0A7D7QZ44_9ACTN|nr:TIGR03086 family metal-binding protein [Gordonia jinghuaiqii]MCR5980613.1 TIGR03086 family protein [Gordonia jinghuaiqii]QMT02669.1 TIGR03086 family protein [Gordonia jinghuaiqii]
MPTDTTQARLIAAAADHMLAMTDSIPDTDLDRPTPCRGMNLAALLAHVDGLSQGLTAAARKDFGPLTSTPPDPAQNPQSQLPTEWRDELHRHVHDLAESWADAAAWEGMTQAGGVELPAEIMGMVALSELVLHGWDVARAADTAFDIPDEILQAVFDFHHPPQPQVDRDRIFGPVVEVPDDAPLVDRLAGLAGRDPRWPHGPSGI